jgi:hypothetical protein
MAPVVETVLDVETIRDGGSLAATFLDKHGAKWILFLKIDMADHEGKVERLGFKEPVLIDADPAKRRKDTERRIYSELSGPAHRLTWEDAQGLVAQIARLPTELTEWATRSLNLLRIAVDGRGSLPETYMTTASQLLEIWTHRLAMNQRNVTKEWSRHLEGAVERLIENLKAIPPDERIHIDADESRDPIARFIRASTGEVVGEINKPL